nr:hypothetical protein GCM10025730_04820 [Promicromonospora thailandica]
MDVGLGFAGDVEVDDESDAVDVEAAGGDVGGDEDVEGSGAEAFDDLLAFLLGDVAGDGGGGDALLDEGGADVFCCAAGAGEDDGGVGVGGGEDAGEGADLVAEGDDGVGLADGGDGGGLPGDGDLDRVGEVLVGDLADGGGMVAEKRATWRLAGAWPKISSTSSAKPMRSISSASSRTRKRMSSRLRAPRSRWSLMRPGVPTTTWTPSRRARCWGT